MKKPRKKSRPLTPEERYFLSGLSRSGVHLRRKWLESFSRVNNRKKRLIYQDVLDAGYPMAELLSKSVWREVHEWCRDEFGKNNYVWFGNRFFFLDTASRNKFVEAWK